MKENRRNFVKKSASLAAALSMGGIGSAVAGHSDQSQSKVQVKPYVKDAGIKFAFMIGPISPKFPFAKQLGFYTQYRA